VILLYVYVLWEGEMHSIYARVLNIPKLGEIGLEMTIWACKILWRKQYMSIHNSNSVVYDELHKLWYLATAPG